MSHPLLERLESAQVHLLDAGPPPRGDGNVVRLLPQHGAGHVVGDVASSNHDHLAAERQRLPQRHTPQELDTSDHAGRVGILEGEAARAFGPNRDHHGAVIAEKVGEGHVLADRDP